MIWHEEDQELMSRYRYAAVSNHADGTGPLAAYFHGEMMNLPGASASIFDRNKFLAEDRILAFGKLILRPVSHIYPYLITYSCYFQPRDLVSAGLTCRNRYQETSEMEVTIREICKSRNRCPIDSTRVHLSTTKMA